MNDDRVFAKCAWRLIPFMALLFLVNYIDRVNVGFAALTMNKDLGFSPATYGFGAGVFFIGYVLFQVPANVILERVGARRVVFCILATWGLISAACALVQGPASFYALRFILGIAEAGFFPGMIFYLTLWFPQAYRARHIAGFYSAIPLAFIVGAPLSGVILGMDGVAGLHGWQWLFLLEGLPAFLVAFAVLKLLPNGPTDAAWLSGDEKVTIALRLAAEDMVKHRELWPALRDSRVLVFGLAYLGILFSSYGIQLWLPQIVQGMGFSNLATGFVVALPFVASMVVMILWGRSSDMRDDRIWHVALPGLFAATGFVVASLAQSNLLSLVALSVALVGLLAMQPPFFSLLSSFLGGTAAAGGIALVVAIGNLGGFLGPYMIGALKEKTGSYAASMAALAVAMLLSAVIVLTVGRALAPRPAIVMPKAGGS
jgi:MFS transporter, ACS family, tartrate transporter